MTQTRTAWVIGATGLVGRETVKALLEDPSIERVVAFVRKPSFSPEPRLEERVLDFEALPAALAGEKADVAISCLGTTLKQAGSEQAFRRVDHDYVVAFAQAALAAGARHFLVVTALGADPGSRVFYNRVKGEVEQVLSALSFAALSIARPSLLLGDRTEFRLGERLAAPFSRLLPARVRGIEVQKVGRALARLARDEATGVRVVPSEELQQLGA